MFEIGLRMFVLFLCGAVVLTAAQIALWTVKPWYHAIRGSLSADFVPEQTVMISPVDMIEGGKIKNVEGKSLARRLSHLVTEIHSTLTRDLEDEYRVLSLAGYSMPNPTVRHLTKDR